MDSAIAEIKRHLAANRDVILTAPPGSGKTTRVPPALINESWLGQKRIVMLEPRRLAATSCAEYIARSSFGEPAGATVGYQVRLERKISKSTRLEIITEGLLAQRFIADPELANTGLVIFDEFHERSLACDLSFALALDVRRALRPDMRLLVMSATLDVDELAAHLDNPAIVETQGRAYPVETHYLGDVSMSAAISKALSDTQGDILCFLPGEGEIRRVAETVSPLLAEYGAVAMPLFGSLAKDEQDRIFKPCPRRKVILSTSIAETSLTIPGITCVIDSGLMRGSRFTPSTGMSGLVTLPLTLDRAEQRRGRAGRVAPGTCYRLWDKSSEASRGRKMSPEILDADLAPTVLASAAFGATRRDALPWLTSPASAAWDQATALLKDLGALDDSGRITAKGEEMARLAMHPRLANMILSSKGDNKAPLLAAIIEERGKSRETDIRKALDEIRETPNKPYSHRILSLAKRFAASARSSSENRFPEGALLAMAFPDRIARNRGNGTFRMVSGRGAMLEREDPLAKSPFIVCCSLDDRLGDAKVFLASPIDKEDIESLFSSQMTDETLCEWDRRDERVNCKRLRKLGWMVFSETDSSRDADPDATIQAMIAGIKSKGVENMPCWTKEALQLRDRIRFVHRFESACPNANDETILNAAQGFLSGMMKWRDLEKLDMRAVLRHLISSGGFDIASLDRLAPERLTVPSGSRMLIHYDGNEPTVEVKLQ